MATPEMKVDEVVVPALTENEKLARYQRGLRESATASTTQSTTCTRRRRASTGKSSKRSRSSSPSRQWMRGSA